MESINAADRPVHPEDGHFLGDYTGLAVRGTEFLTAYATTTAADPASILVSTLTP